MMTILNIKLSLNRNREHTTLLNFGDMYIYTQAEVKKVQPKASNYFAFCRFKEAESVATSRLEQI